MEVETNGTVAAGMISDASVDTAKPTHQFSEFERDLNALVRKHFPHWNARDISKL